MRYSILVKFIAVALSAIALVAGFASVLGIVQVAELGLYTDGFDGWIDNRLERQAYGLAEDLTERFAVRRLTNCSDEVLEELGYFYIFEESIHWTGLEEESYDYAIAVGHQTLTSEQGIPKDKQRLTWQVSCSVEYPVLVTSEETIDANYGTEYAYKETVNMEAFGGRPVTVRYYESPNYTVTVTLDAEAAMSRAGTSLELVQLIYKNRYRLMVVLAVSILLLAAGLVYLCCAAGKNDVKAEVNPRGLNRLALDVYAGIGVLISYFLGTLAVRLINYWIFTMDNLNPGTLTLVGLVIFAIALICIGFYFALCAQVKLRGNFWWNNSALGWLTRQLLVGARMTVKGFAVLMGILPSVWSYLVVGSGMGIAVGLGVVLAYEVNAIPLLIAAVLYLTVVLYSGYAYGVIVRGAEKMAEGDLNTKIETRFLISTYRKCALHLNALADVAQQAAKNQLRADRLKTELITNVSHDIKTPLTSIINYVDILRSATTEEEAQQYMEVLSRQSQRLKKLIEDLMEMSKASSGNMHVDWMTLDPVEAVNQALGEFDDKLCSKELTVVFQQPDIPLSIWADGRLTWRVLSNLLSNIVKYAMPGTRVYADVVKLEDQVLISLKNISREPLNVSAEELTERFVRGDASRNTEGSGLGLNIAKSLMELQKGKLELLVDGDLFKATLIFPETEK